MKIIVLCLFLFAACGDESDEQETAKCDLSSYDKVGQKLECPDAGTCDNCRK